MYSTPFHILFQQKKQHSREPAPGEKLKYFPISKVFKTI
jgi:hypothetical protein